MAMNNNPKTTAKSPAGTESQKKGVFGTLWRGLLWLGGAMFAILALGVLFLIGANLQNQHLKSDMQSFCNAFRAGQPLSPGEAVRRAGSQNYETQSGNLAPLNGRGDPLPTVFVRKMSWSGTLWRCTVQFKEGQVSAVEFRGRGLVD